MKIVVVSPTYNEALNIELFIEALSKVFETLNEHEMHFLVVDGNSPDGTAEIASKMAETRPWLHVLRESAKRGLGAAYAFGFKHAMDVLNADVIVEMDPDFQHDPNELPKIIQPLTQGYDHVIGSRFIKGGSIPKEWSLYRRFLSVFGNLGIKFVFGIFSINDFTTGFKATRVKGFMDNIDFEKLKSKGFAYKMEILFKLHRMGAKIIQVPIKFGLRDRGTSKMENENLLDSVKVGIILRVEEKKEFVKFCIVGGAGFITDFGLFNFLILADTHPKVSAVVSGLLAMVVTFTLNNKWSFGKRKIESYKQQAVTFPFYAASSLIPIFLRSKFVEYSIIWFGHFFLVYNFAFLIGVGFGLIWNYIIYSKIIWKRK